MTIKEPYKLNSFLKTERNFWYIYFAISVVYILFFSGILALLIPIAGHDDALYFNMANNILAQKWLGDYSSILLSKVPGYGIFLAACMATGMPYMLLLAICYAVAVAFFLKTSLWLFEKSRYLSLAMGLVLLYNPIFASVTRIYRNPFSAICFLIFIGTIVALFNPQKEKEHRVLRILMGFVSFFGTGFLFYTREETLLYYLLLAIALFASVILCYKKLISWQNIRLLTIGMAGVLILGFTISFLNYRYYGIFTVCEKTSGAYPTAMKAFQQVADPWQDAFIPEICPSLKKIEHIAEVIPEFKPLADEMLDSNNTAFRESSTYFNANSMQIMKLDSQHIPASHFEWYWIESLNKAGFCTNATKAAEYHEVIAPKINRAIKNGKLEKRKILLSVGPYFIMKQDIATIIKVLPQNYSDLFYTPESFSKKFKNFAINKSFSGNPADMEKHWAVALNVNYVSAIDDVSQNMLKNKAVNRFWNFVIMLFSWLVVPMFHLATPLALVAVFLSIKKQMWYQALPVVILIIGFWAHFAMLSAIDVVVGYNASNYAYFLPSYAIILAAFFISLAIIIGYCRTVKKDSLNIAGIAPEKSITSK